MALNIPDLPHPTTPLTTVVNNTFIMTRDWWAKLADLVRALQQRTGVADTATFAAASSVAVTFATPEPNANYNVLIEGVANRTYWVTSKATTGFTINASASNSDTVGWVLFRR